MKTTKEIKEELLEFVKHDDVFLFELPNYPGFEGMTHDAAMLVCDAVNELQSSGLLRVTIHSVVKGDGSHDFFDAVLTIS